ncbi:retinoic acid-induced protein 2-like [Alosa alosa]|uniref:retinoic acid-induced protein 2-like n=1 Tax=Alosa alosa TaxID=278164 RepID=UPI00201535E3|nr:retinoic acid-induced protein 2-like [Alosa alosa]
MDTKNNHSGFQSEMAQSPNSSAPICPAQGLNIEPSGTITLKMHTAVLPLCLGEGSVFLPVHLQMPTGAQGKGISPAGSSPFLLPSHGPGSLSLMLEQHVFQHFNSQFLPQGVLCSAPPPLQNSMLHCNSPFTLCQPSPMEPKVAEREPAPVTQDGLAGFAAISQDQFTTHNSFTPFGCQMAGPNPTQTFAPNFVPTPPSLPLPYACSSPLTPLVPPPTLLVPFPIIVPLPVPVPVPIPIPLRPKAELHEPRSTAAVSTQTCDGIFSSVYVSHTAGSEGVALDLSTTAGPLSQLKQEASVPQDSPLDLSVAYHVHKPLVQVEQPDVKQPVKNVPRSARSLEVLPPLGCGQNLDSEFLNGVTSLELSRHHKWLMDGRCSHEPKYGARNYEIVSASQTAKVIVAVKDSVPTIFRGKLKDLAGVPANTFPSKQDMEQGALAQQHYSPVLTAQSETGHLTDPKRSTPRNRSVKLKKVSSQEIHILPIKKQRFTAFLHRE